MEAVLYLYFEFTRERRSFKPSLVLWYGHQQRHILKVPREVMYHP